MSLKYAVIGTGAIGGYYGGKLANAGKEVHFLFNSDYEYVKAHGLKVDSINGDFQINSILAYNRTADMPQCDVVLVCLKSTKNHLLKELLPPLLHQDTIVILIQNGLGLEADLQKDFPELNIAGGLAFICSQKVGAGHIKHLDQGRLNIGSFSCANNAILNEVCSDFKQTAVGAKVVELNTARWTKLVWNIPYNGLTVVLNATTDQLMDNVNTFELIRLMMLEVIHAANHSGCSIPESCADDMLSMTRKMVPYSPSMKLDYEAHRMLEIMYIYSRPIQQALRNGFEMHRVSMLERQLQFLSDRNINK